MYDISKNNDIITSFYKKLKLLYEKIGAEAFGKMSKGTYIDSFYIS